jgi:hypothetical protein
MNSDTSNSAEATHLSTGMEFEPTNVDAMAPLEVLAGIALPDLDQ